MNNLNEKRFLRNYIKKCKESFTQQELLLKSNQVTQKLESEQIFQNSQFILLYSSLPDEVYTHDLILKYSKKKQILLPIINGNNLELRYFEGYDKMKQNTQFKILEPQGVIFTNFKLIDLMIIPGIAFDKQNNRLGRGKGFYDRFLKLTDSYKIGLCFDFQLLEKIPTGELDVKMNKVIC